MKKGRHLSESHKKKISRTRLKLAKQGLLKSGRTKLPPIYELAYGIKVISERKAGKYVYCRIDAPRRLFPNSRPDTAGRVEVQRARVIMIAKLGRALKRSEHVHHKNERRKMDDSLSNLEVLTAAAHNKHHKTGTHHKRLSRKKIGDGVHLAYIEGRMKRHRWFGKKNPFFGKKHSAESLRKMRRPRKRRL